MGVFDPDFSEDGIPHQPDDIEEDSHDVPAPEKAAPRVKAFIEEFGDGIIMAVNRQPLYSRDVWALAKYHLDLIQAGTWDLNRLKLEGFTVHDEDADVALYHDCANATGGEFVNWVGDRSLKEVIRIAREHSCGEEGQELGWSLNMCNPRSNTSKKRPSTSRKRQKRSRRLHKPRLARSSMR